MVYHIEFLEFLNILQKRGLLNAIYRISVTSPKTWSIICSLWNLFPFSIKVDCHMKFREFLSLLRKYGLSYAISGISYASPKNVDYNKQLLKFLSLQQRLDYHV